MIGYIYIYIYNITSILESNKSELMETESRSWVPGSEGGGNWGDIGPRAQTCS